jgi:ATP-dependent helicase/DNAse subunit B
VTSQLVVVPTHAHAAFARAEEARGHARGVFMGRGVMTLGELFASVTSAALPGARVLGPLEERLVLRLAASSEAAARGRFARIASTPGFVAALGATVATCRQAGVSAAHLRSVEGALPLPVAGRVADVASMVAETDAILARLGAVDREGALSRVARALRDGAPLPTGITATSRIVVRHVHELPPSRLAFFDALASRVADLTIELPHDEEERAAGTAWFRATERTLERAEAAGAAASLTLLPVPPSEWARGVGAFVADALSGRAHDGQAAEIEVVRAPSVAAEHAVVARRVRDFVDAGVAPERIVVAARDLDAHAGPLAEALRDAGVPVHERRGAAAEETPPLRFLFDAMEAASEGLPKEAVLRLLSSAYAPRWAQSRGDAAELARVLREVGARGGRGSRRGQSLLAALERLAGARDAPEALGQVRSAVADFVERAAPLGEPATVVELVARVRRFVEVSGLADAVSKPSVSLPELVRGARDPLAEAEARAFGRDQAALDVLEVALSELEEAAARLGLEGSFQPQDAMGLLRDALSAHAIAAGGLRGGAVRIVALRDLAGLPVEVAFLCGLRDGELPAPPADDPLLSVSDRHAVGRALAQRPDGPRYTFDVAEETHAGAVAFSTGREVEPLLFHLAATSPSKHLILSHACTDDDGRPVVPSQILDDALETWARAGAQLRIDELAIEPAPQLLRASTMEEARRAWVRAFAEVDTATTSAAAAGIDPRDAVLGDDPLRIAPLLERVHVERGRLATMLAVSGPDVGPFAGQLGPAHRRPAQRVSASALEDLARCPFQYFAKRVLRIEPDHVGEDDPDARQKGTVAHACFEAAIEALRAKGLVPYDPERSDEAMDVARAAALQVATPRFATLPIDEHVAALARDDIVERVVTVVRALYEQDDGYVPTFVEHDFGPGKPWPAVTVGDVALHGRIDLVERKGDLVRVTDLKSGGRVGLEGKLHPDRLGHTELQLPIYAAAAKKATDARAVDGRYLSLKDGAPTRSISDKRASTRSAWKNDPRSDEDVFEVALDSGNDTALGGRIRDLLDRIAAGDFEVRPEKGACQYCEFAAICRLPRGAPDADEVEGGS